ncbi:hypothetical protein PanWU01x14_358870 [Parasponia andersonii]|uniref:Uncharacterized protein n=1 Tax=Parasponia andersonii TaxID=3476 RepID=A0A2P5A861_PARAD|nr:hypothetical protein PanWU01x14_358870 [Parasponia andersonii]
MHASAPRCVNLGSYRINVDSNMLRRRIPFRVRKNVEFHMDDLVRRRMVSGGGVEQAYESSGRVRWNLESGSSEKECDSVAVSCTVLRVDCEGKVGCEIGRRSRVPKRHSARISGPTNSA